MKFREREFSRRAILGGGLAIAASGAGARNSGHAQPASGLAFAGVSLAGGEFGKIPGTYGTDYIYPAPANIDYFAQLGFNLVRVPFRWERLQPRLGAPLAATDLALLSSVVDYASAKGLHVVLDTHNYARRRTAADGWIAEHLIGSESVPTAAFADFCARLAATFKGDPRVIFGLMNEPWGLAAEDWLAIANRALAAMRQEGAGQLVLVPGIAYTGAHSWIASGNAAMGNVVDALNNFAFEVHQYFDVDSSGTSPTAVGPRIGTQRIESFQRWARGNGFRAFLGEFAAGEDETSLEALADMCRTLESNSDVWIGWAAWAGGAWWPADYIFNLEPLNGQMRPQTKLLAGCAQRIGIDARGPL
jgi:endoglucanase